METARPADGAIEQDVIREDEVDGHLGADRRGVQRDIESRIFTSRIRLRSKGLLVPARCPASLGEAA
jgi:hypothetical protein